MRSAFLWLALAELRQTWLRSGLAALAIALAILAVTLFARQIELQQAELLASYEDAGAATFVAEVSGIADGDVEALASAIRGLGSVRSLEAPYSGVELGIVADTSFLVFQNDKQQESLGARTNVLGADPTFDPARDYYVNLNDVSPQAPRQALGIPLMVKEGTSRTPGPGEILVAAAAAEYVGVRPGAEASVELVYTGIEPPIVRRLDGLRLTGTFDVIGPDEGRFDPFWRFSPHGREVLTVRGPGAEQAGTTTLPIILNAEVVRQFLEFARGELAKRGQAIPQAPPRRQLVIRATHVGDVPTAEAAVGSLLRKRGLPEDCEGRRPGSSFCLRLPERNNFQAALQEKGKVGTGGAFFVALLVWLVGIGTAGLQIQTILARWRDFGILQAVGFSPAQTVGHFALQLSAILIGGLALAAIASVTLLSATAGSLASFAWAAGVSIFAAGLSALPVLLWPLWRSPAALLREAV